MWIHSKLIMYTNFNVQTWMREEKMSDVLFCFCIEFLGRKDDKSACYRSCSHLILSQQTWAL